MKRLNIHLCFLLCFFILGCKKSSVASPSTAAPIKTVEIDDDAGGVTRIAGRPASIGLIGDSSNVITPVNGGTVLMGGGKDVEAAFKWMIERSGGGDVVVIRASGTDAYNPFINEIGKVNSVETLKIDNRELANNDTVANIIRNAEMLFIAGGDQSNYMKFWRNTKVNDALNYLLTVKKVPVGGTSAGCAILSGFYFSGENGSVVSEEALSDPYTGKVTVYNNDFLHAPFLQNTITDQHYLTRTREGRHVAFIGRILNDYKTPALGIAADEKTAVCIDKDGKAQVFGLSKAYFIMPDGAKLPEQFIAGKPVIWKQNEQALSVYEIQASLSGAGYYNVSNFNSPDATGGKWYWWWTENGKLNKKEK
ncbi:cyanophycinase [Daejeonella lutea]|uniref:Cyanophycinase n=1 Tax=Daejeonella lutea TaxID=572036 RepID=A0A1T5CU19_9SPHI|nr:cyanophycinase [Daejeonella lutea]SKB62867.1 Cyanophycinase [Daejeonella lutea]